VPEIPLSVSAPEHAPVGAHDMSAGAVVLDRVADAATRALRQWPGGAEATTRLLHLSENATFAVDSPAGRTVLRLHRLGYHDRPAIESELAWLDAVRAEAGVRTPRVVAARDGRRVVEVSDGADGPPRSAVMFEWLPGTEPGPGDAGAFERLGELTARLHRHARRWSPPAGFTRFTWDADTTIGARGRWGPWHDGPGVGRPEGVLLDRLAGVLRARLAAYGRGPGRFGLIHADLRPANLLVGEAGATSVIDFDDCGYGWFLYDLGAAVSFFEDDRLVPGLIDRWLIGYRRVLELPAADEAEIWTFVLLRRLALLAWIGSHAVADEAQQLGPGFAAGTCELAERYLGRAGGPGNRPMTQP
jgi:Ser/Thr protein kinase RdoA (MazF antagonist)